jgi:DNA invertase Pin-like site-specific DNA recombinase
MKWGYVRVSTVNQDETRQVEALLNAGVERENIIIEKASGKDFKRPLYTELIDQKLKPFDTLVLTKLDRLGRNTELLKEEIKKITETRLCSIIFVEQPMLNYTVTLENYKNVTNDFLKSLLFMFISFISEWEREEMLERQRKAYNSLERNEQGKMISRRTGKVVGREKKVNSLTEEEKKLIKDWIRGKITCVRVMEILKISRPTLKKIKAEYLGEEIEL